MRHHVVLGIFAALVVSSAAGATECSIRPTKGSTDAQLTSLAKVTQADAQKLALARVKSPATIAGAELEAEHGCLLWSFDLAVTGKPGIQEVQIDAGNGRVLSVKHESAKHEAAEATQEAAEAKKH